MFITSYNWKVLTNSRISSKIMGIRGIDSNRHNKTSLIQNYWTEVSFDFEKYLNY